MAKGDFLFEGIDTTTFTSAELTGKTHGADVRTAGMTLAYLYVTIEVACAKPEHEEGESEELTPICKGTITDYSLLVKSYVGNDVRPGLPARSVEAHELYHVKNKKQTWDAHKAELDLLLTAHVYECLDPECKFEMVQDVFAWFVARFFSDDDEEKQVQKSQRVFQGQVTAHGGTVAAADKVLNGVFGADRMAENVAAAKGKKVKVAPRFSSRVHPTFTGKCGAP